MKLINADEFLELMTDRICIDFDTIYRPYAEITVKEALEKMPTAYDVDAVIKQLDAAAERHGGEDYYVEIGDAIEIVRNGGLNANPSNNEKE